MSALAAAVLDALDDDALEALAELLAPRIARRAPEPERTGAEWLDAKGAAAHLGLTLPALHRLTTRSARQRPDAIPAHQDVPGGKLWFSRSELDEWRRRR